MFFYVVEPRNLLAVTAEVASSGLVVPALSFQQVRKENVPSVAFSTRCPTRDRLSRLEALATFGCCRQDCPQTSLGGQSDKEISDTSSQVANEVCTHAASPYPPAVLSARYKGVPGATVKGLTMTSKLWRLGDGAVNFS